MRKIIGFKLNLRPTEIQRKAKKAGVTGDAQAVAARITALIPRAQQILKPAVLFDTFPRADLDQKQLSPLRGVAYSIILATVGEGFKHAALDADPLDAALMAIIEQVALEECLHFAGTLIGEEATKESCELSPLNALAEPQALEIALGKLDGLKIGVRIEAGTLMPTATRLVTLSWLSKGKAKVKGSGVRG